MSADCFLIPHSLIPLAVNEKTVRKSSSLLDKLMQTTDFQAKRVLCLQLRIPYPDECLKKAMDFAATGQLNLETCSNQQMMELAEELGMQELQDQLKSQNLPKPEPILPAGNLFPIVPLNLNPFLAQLSAFHMQQMQQNLWMQLVGQFQLPTPTNVTPELDDTGYRRRTPREMRKSVSLDMDEPFDNMGDVIIPSSDKEGWCRNKKYIEKTDAGYQCTVCKKTYGRYNSVSYHVTIYHRNPPIKCDLPGCQFTTREARYIHFHKYYRHGVQLPITIDQGTRKCPHCKHVSKSPAMLEKHVRRHLLETTPEEGQNSADVVVDIMDDVEGSRSRATSLSTTMDIDVEGEVQKQRALTL